MSETYRALWPTYNTIKGKKLHTDKDHLHFDISCSWLTSIHKSIQRCMLFCKCNLYLFYRLLYFSLLNFFNINGVSSLLMNSVKIRKEKLIMNKGDLVAILGSYLWLYQWRTPGMSDLARLAPNKINIWLFKINFLFSLA